MAKEKKKEKKSMSAEIMQYLWYVEPSTLIRILSTHNIDISIPIGVRGSVNQTIIQAAIKSSNDPEILERCIRIAYDFDQYEAMSSRMNNPNYSNNFMGMRSPNVKNEDSDNNHADHVLNRAFNHILVSLFDYFRTSKTKINEDIGSTMQLVFFINTPINYKDTVNITKIKTLETLIIKHLTEDKEIGEFLKDPNVLTIVKGKLMDPLWYIDVKYPGIMGMNMDDAGMGIPMGGFGMNNPGMAGMGMGGVPGGMHHMGSFGFGSNKEFI